MIIQDGASNKLNQLVYDAAYDISTLTAAFK